MFKEYDLILAKTDLEKVSKGTKGTILIVYDDKKHFEVEFVDTAGNTLNILTVSESQIEHPDLDFTL